MQKNTTDYIAKLSWDAVKNHWKEFMVVPLAPLGVAFVIGLLMSLGSSQFGFGSSLQGLIALIQLLYLALILFYVVYGGAASKWCETLFSGKKDLDIAGGLRYGLSRLGGSLGTAILTGLKIFLWTLLFVFPGIYKMLVYSQSVQISHLEKISGGDANRLSKKLISEAGILRTLGNYMTLLTLMYLSILVFYVIGLFAVPFILFTKDSSGAPLLMIGVGIVFVVLLFAWMAAIMGFATCFKNFQYLVYRDENKAAFQKAIKELKTING